MKHITLQPRNNFRFNKEKDDWTLIETVPLSNTLIKLGLFDFPTTDANNVSVEKMRLKVEKMKIVGQHQAENLLFQQKIIPAEWSEQDLIFIGTTWSDDNNELRCPGLSYTRNKQEWSLGFYRELNNKFHRLVCLID